VDRLDLASRNVVADNMAYLADRFPNVVTVARSPDGSLVEVVDWDALRQEFADRVLEGPSERYQLDWPGKRAAAFAANARITKTLRPTRDESVDFDTTKNLFIEGDNLEALKLLHESYLGKVKVIYIDPPYNTGKDFVYDDRFAGSVAQYLEQSGQASAAGERLVANSESNGRFHSDWLSMIYPRLKLARSLLAADGVIFVSIDDHEVANLRLLLDEVFGRANFVENYIWESNFRPDNSSRVERENAQHVLCYSRDRASMPELVGAQRVTEGLPSLTKSSMAPTTLSLEPDWVDFGLNDGTYPAGKRESGYVLEDAVTIAGGRAQRSFRLTGRVIWSQAYLERQVAEGTRIVIKGPGFVPYSKKLQTSALAPTTLIPRDVVGDVLAGNAEIRALFGSQVFNHPKPTTLLKYLIGSVTDESKSGIVLDFFAGSGSTADAVLRLNAEDGGRRPFILVQLDEAPGADTEAARAGYLTISSLSRERIRRAAAMVRSAGFAATTLDSGFRALRVDSSNMVDVSRTPGDTEQLSLSALEGSVKDDRSDEDMLFQVMLDWGLELSEPIAIEEVEDRRVLSVAEGALIACFADEVSDAVVKEIASRRPLRAVFLDAGFTSDAARINAEQIFREVSPGTEVKAV
jgi:adenine-specific DNA-methyltransferase